MPHDSIQPNNTKHNLARADSAMQHAISQNVATKHPACSNFTHKDFACQNNMPTKTADNDLLLVNYDFSLPQNLIATTPIMPKENARLLIYHNGTIVHTTFSHLFEYIPKDYLIVLNDTKVIPARLFAQKLNKESFFTQKASNAHNLQDFLLPTKRELFYHKSIDSMRHLVQIKGRAKLYDIFVLHTHTKKSGNAKNTSAQSKWHKAHNRITQELAAQVIHICDNGYKEVIFFPLCNEVLDYLQGKKDSLLRNDFMQEYAPHKDSILHAYALQHNEVLEFLESHGTIPLPPYIKRDSTQSDVREYQSIFAKHKGSVAAPTASLHFSESMLSFLQENYAHAFVTLHVGAGTFQPVSSHNILEHTIHAETCMIAAKEAQKIMQAEKILCIGTTAMRSVEWLMRHNGDIKGDIIGENSIFLHPHNRPQKVKALLTNFHLPKSSLLMLVSSLIGRKETFRIYEEAIAHKYRFYSYGDGMLLI